MLYFQSHETIFYQSLKKFITCQLSIPTQAVRRNSILKSKAQLSIASKILLQINQKIGGHAWEAVHSPNSYIAKRRVMCAGISISKGPKGYSLAFVGTIDAKMNRVCSFCKIGYRKKENIKVEEIEDLFIKWG